jgi:peptidoglycan/LPS O-acetylase OafA/YrhL
LRIGNAVIGRAAVSVAIPFAAWNTFDPILPGSFGLAAGYAVMIAVIALASKTTAMAAPRALRYLGDISYTLYLEHMAVIHVLHQVYRSMGLTDLSATWSIVPLTLVACIAVAALTGRFLERDLLTGVWAVCRADGWRVVRALRLRPAS